jgi:tetratricopeptide (TPR) repeat protein
MADPLPEDPKEEDEKDSRRDPSRIEFPLLRQMMVERRFMVAVVVAALLCVTALVGLPKIWTATPFGFEPKVRVSLLDRLQTRSLSQAARAAAAAGQWTEAIQTWAGAVANNAADIEANRGLVRAVLAAPDPERRELGRGIQQLFWLFRLDGTNSVNLTLLGEICEKYSLDDLNISMLLPHRQVLSQTARRSLLKAAFRGGQMELFGALWNESKEVFAADPELVVYHAAWAAGWGPVIGISSGQARLKGFLEDPSTALLAHQVHLQLAASRQDAESYGRSLEFLVDRHADSLSHHAGHWTLLIQSGRSAEAAALARKINSTPRTPVELIRIASLLNVLGLREESIQLMQRNLEIFSFHTQVWVAMAELLANGGRWGELRILGLQLRNDPRQRQEVPGYGWFLEGYGAIMAVRQSGSMPEAEFRKVGSLEFQEMLRSHISDPLIGYRCAVQLQQLGHPDVAKSLFEGMEKSFGGRADYWFRLGLAAYQTDDIRLMLTANEKAYQISPEEPLIINNLAAALLMLREQPARAAELTLRRVARNPDDLAARINHILALVLNRRTGQARSELTDLRPESLGALEASLIHLARFEIAVIEGDIPAAAAELPRIEKRFLKSAQAEWLDRETRRLGTGN